MRRTLTVIDQDLPLVATKPLRFLDQNNKHLPKLLDLRFDRAPGFEHLSHDEYTKLLRDEVAKAEQAAADERREKGITIVGRANILKQHWNAKPSSREPRRGMSPRVACKNKWARIEALHRNKAFIEQYHDARMAKLTGQDVVHSARDMVVVPLRRREARRARGHCSAELTLRSPPDTICGASPRPTSVLAVRIRS